MPNFFLYHGDVLVQTGSCPECHLELQLRDGLQLGVGDPPEHIKYPPPPDKTISELRAESYPPISDQLGALMKGGQELLDMQAKILAVKEKHPKHSP